MNNNNEEKTLSILEALSVNVGHLTTEFRVINSKVDILEIKVDKLKSKVDNLEIRMLAAERQAARNLELILGEFERSNMRILSYFEDGALNFVEEQGKVGFELQ